MKNSLLLAAVILLTACSSLYAEEIKGTEFYVTFLPNMHNNWDQTDPLLKYGDSVYIFIYAELDTKADITYTNTSNQTFTESFTITANSIYTFKKRAYDHALRGFNLSGDITSRNHSEKICNVSFHLTTDNPVIIYGHSQAVTTSESFNILPIESVGKEYIISAYNSSGMADGFVISEQSTPSQFAIVATEDQTSVKIKPSVQTYFNNNNEQNIVLNKGEVYLVQAKITVNQLNLDLTGTQVSSDKPIAVFAGHQRAKIPYGLTGQSTSRDFLAEQLPPLESWNSEVIAVPFPVPSSIETRDIYDLLRIMAAYDNTEIEVNGTRVTTLSKGKYYELNLDQPFSIKASSPILATAFKRTSQRNSGGESVSDPLMQIVPSIEQYGNNYKFIAIQAYEYVGTFLGKPQYDPVYTEHYITLIVPESSYQQVLLDGNLISPSIFKKIPNTEYYWGVKAVSVGIHEVRAAGNFGLFVCGYGYANSYGYFSGVITKRDDFEPPQFQSSNKCFSVDGIVTDMKISEIFAAPNSAINVNLKIDSFIPYAQQVKFYTELQNRRKDGYVRVVARDSIRQQNYIDVEIPGFTIGITSNADIETEEIYSIQDTIGFNNTKCYPFIVKNYGKYPQKITKNGLKSTSGYFTTNLPAQFVLQPNEQRTFEICYESDISGWKNDTLFIETECSKADFIALAVFTSKDDDNPKFNSKTDPCNVSFDIVFTDSLKTDRGIMDVIFDFKENIEIIETFRSAKLTNLKAIQTDPFKDSYFQIRVIDSAGFETVYSDSIPGFTLSLSGLNINLIDSLKSDMDFSNKSIGIQYCDTVKLFNYGNFDITIDELFMAQNIIFSLPLAQLPLVIKSGTNENVYVCFRPVKASDNLLTDTLYFPFKCLKKEISISGKGDSILIENKSKCEVTVLFSANETAESAFVSALYPNPAGSVVKYQVSAPVESDIRGEIWSSNGVMIDRFIDNKFSPGIYEFNVDVSKLSSGLYFRVNYINGEKFIHSFIVE